MNADDSEIDLEDDEEGQEEEEELIECESMNVTVIEPPNELEISQGRPLRWKKCKMFESSLTLRESVEPDVADIQSRDKWSSTDYFQQYINYEFFQLMAEMTNRKVVAKTGTSPNVTACEMRKFIGISLLMSCMGLPQIRMYWNQTTRVPVIADAMSRDRYFMIRSNLKVVDDNEVSDEEKRNRLWKVQPILTAVIEKCKTLPRTHVVSIDEQMIPFTGTTQLKQYVPNKPNPVGLKNYVLCQPCGLVLDFEIYQGKGTFSSSVLVTEESSVAESSILRLCETLLPGTHVFFDRFFTSVQLIEKLHLHEIGATGTLMKSRVPKNCILEDDNKLAKCGRGACAQSVRSDGVLCIVKWVDNKPIYFASSVVGVGTEDKCKRWSKKEKQYLDIPRPQVVKEYNTNMGGVDMVDRIISYYRVKARTNKWTVRTILHFIDMASANCWLEYRQDQEILKGNCKKYHSDEYIYFKLQLANALISAIDSGVESLGYESDEQSYEPPKKKITPLPSTSFRRSHNGHLPEIATIKNSAVCRNPECNKKTKVRCVKCNMFLCLTSERNCYANFHNL